jgi:RNA polymerase sigma-70 factor (ECF subfamily)
MAMASVASLMEHHAPLANVEAMVPPQADESLVAAAKSGDHAAFVELWARHSNLAFKTAYRIMGNQDDAEDAIQEAWMKAYVHLNTFNGRSKFSTWLARITINSALMTLRRRRTRPEISMDVLDGEAGPCYEIADQGMSVEELLVRHETAEHLGSAIGRLRPTLRTVVEIHQSNDGSVKELAELAGISIAATKSRLLRARKVLRKTLEYKSKDFPLEGSTRIEQSASPGAANGSVVNCATRG